MTDRVRPEGLEDIDCLDEASGGVYVQAKERAGGDTTWARGEMAEAIAHATDSLRAYPGSRFVLVTNAVPGAGLCDTGWTDSLADRLDDDDLADLHQAVNRHSAGFDQTLLARCSLRQESRTSLTDASIRTLAELYELPPAVAAIGFSVLLDDLQQVASAQRVQNMASAAHRRPADLDAAVKRLVETVDLTALEEPERRGLVASVDFSAPIDLAIDRFLSGVDVRPGHIAAGLDVVRAAETTAVLDALEGGRGAMVCGPSGAGKSALLWRCAYELGGAARLVEFRSGSADDVEGIARWLRTQRPTPRTPIIVCADDVGRPEMAAWPQLVARSIDIPGLLLLATCREEDLRPEFLAGELELVRPTLGQDLADELAAQLESRGVTLRRRPTEAFSEAEGLLLEYVALITTGERLEHVVTTQVNDRLTSDRAVEREVLRYVSAANLGGLGVPFATLGQLVDRPDDLHAALARLQGEFLVRDDGRCWTGLHELRSAAAHDALHALPPPTEESTICALLSALDPSNAAHLLRRVVDRGMRPMELIEGIRAALVRSDADGVATLVSAAVEVDALSHARECWMMLQALGTPNPDSVLMVAFIARFGDVPELASTSKLRDLSRALPEQPTTVASDATRALNAEAVLDRVLSASAEHAAELLEHIAITQSVELSPEGARSIVRAHEPAEPEHFARIVYATSCLTPGCLEDALAVLGARNVRLDRLAAADDRVVGWSAEGQGAGLKVTVEVFMIDGELSTEVRSYLGRLTLDLCPEATAVRLEVRAPQGVMKSVPAQEGMDIERSGLPNHRIGNRRTRSFLAAIDRLRAANSWSERIAHQEDLCNRLVRLTEGARCRLALSDDNAGRRREWLHEVAAISIEIGRLPSPPLPRKPGETESKDLARDHLKRIVSALGAIANSLQGEDVNLGGLGAGLHDLAVRLRAPASGPGAALVRMVDRELGDQIQCLSRLLLSQRQHPNFRVRARLSGLDWTSTIDRATLSEQQEVVTRERQALEQALDGLSAEIYSVDLCGREAAHAAVEHDDQGPGSRHLVVVPEENRDAAVWERLVALPDATRFDIAFRLFVIPSRAGFAMPTEAWQIGSKTVYPANPDYLGALGLAAGIQVLDSDELRLALALLRSIVDASAAASLAAARRRSRFDESRAVTAAEDALRECRALANAVDNEAGSRSVAHLIEITEQELAGELVVSQIVGDVLLRQYGDENAHSMLMSTTRGILVGLAADDAARLIDVSAR